MAASLTRLVIRQTAILLIALSLVLPRVGVATVEASAIPGPMAQHAHCAEHTGGPHEGHDGSGGHGCCDQCQCCAVPGAAGPRGAVFAALFAPAPVAFANKSVKQRAALAWPILPINSHGPPLPEAMI